MTVENENDRAQKLREESLAFFGAITASVSHELNNVISIIDQTAGLMTDLLAGAQYGRPISEEQLSRIASKIKNQTDRGVSLIKRLNTFAHSTDEPVREFELNQLVENLIALTERLAVIKGVNMSVGYTAQPLNMVSSPFLIQQILFLIIKNNLARAVKNDVIEISLVQPDANHARLVITSIARGTPAPDEEAYWVFLAQVIGGSVNISTSQGNIVFEMLVPGVRA